MKIDASATADEMAETIFGSGVKVVNASYSGDDRSSGIFSGADETSPGFAPSESGVILSTGRAADVTNSSGDANQTSNKSTNTQGINNDADFNAAANQNTFDAAFIEADFIPTGDTLTVQFVFGSEEYPEFVFSGFNDTIGVFVNGEALEISVGAGQTSVDAVNSVNNSNLFVDNQNDEFNTEMDGFTVTLTLTAKVNPDQVNTLKIGVADAGDSVFDSNLLIAANSVQTSVIANDDVISNSKGTAEVFDLLANDENSGDGVLQITQINGIDVVAGDIVTLGTGEQIQLNADGTITAIAISAQTTNTFSYTVENEVGVTDTAFVTYDTTIKCFTPGALIECATGARAVEDLRVGDMLRTRDDGLQAIRWIGASSVMAMRDEAAPIVITKGALGNRRDLVVSPQHRMLLTGWRAELLFGEREVFASAKDLVNGETIYRRPVEQQTYFHLLLDRHSVIYAEGAPTESFHPGEFAVEGLAPPARETLLAAAPRLRENPQGYGPTARCALKSYEARLYHRSGAAA
ncbi:MAG: choice-of-anchor L domain-containing protein [Pikeienuella sp.]